MISLNTDAGAGIVPAHKDYVRVHVRLAHVVPEVSRVLVIPRNANLGWLHAVLQVAMGWTNSHLHHFRLGDRTFSAPSFQLEAFEGDPPVEDEETSGIELFLRATSAPFLYEYDFGDSWMHRITFDAVPEGLPVTPRRATCADGSGACPPEDCGGPPGYANLIKVMGNPKHPEHRSMKAWLGRKLDPSLFSIEDTTGFLAMLPWPRVSERSLRRVLLAQSRAR